MHSGILFKLKSEWNFDICYNIDEPGRHYAKWNKPDIKRQTLYDSISMKYLETESRMVFTGLRRRAKG